jgi:two-component system, NarL family, response regulator YdfI
VTRVLIVAASAVVRAGLESILARDSSLDLAGSVPRLDSLDEQVEALHPDVILVEEDQSEGSARPPLFGPFGDDGLPAVVLLADHPEPSDLADMLRHGSGGVLPRGSGEDEIIAAVHAAAAGMISLHPDTASILAPVLAGVARTAPVPGAESLTPREIEVLAMLAEGTGNKLVARRLGISEHTVKFHVGSILSKLGAASRTEAVTIGLRQGLIMV